MGLGPPNYESTLLASLGSKMTVKTVLVTVLVSWCLMALSVQTGYIVP